MQQILDTIAPPVAGVLAWLYGVYPNYAFIIIALTLVIMAVTTPLTLKSTRSMMLMQQLQPEIKKIQSQYKDDRQRLNEEQMKFFRENNLSPAGGCVPMLVQMPVFIVLYQVLRGMTRREPDLGFVTGFYSGTGASNTLFAHADLRLAFDPAYIDHGTALFSSLAGKTQMMSLGMDFSETASEALTKHGIATAIPYLTLIVIVGATAWVQQKQIQGRNPNAEVNPQQQMIMKVMPFMLPAFSFALPAALVLYFVVSNLYRVGLQAYISRSIYGISAKKSDDAAPPSKPGRTRGGAPPKAGGPSKGGPKGPASKGGDSLGRDATPGRGQKPARGRPSQDADGDEGDTTRGRAGSTRERAGVGVAKTGAKSAPKDDKPGSTSRSKSTPGTQKGQQDKATSAPSPTLQPRARKPKKR